MKKKFSLTSLVLVLSILFSFVMVPHVSAQENQQPSLAALGDSISAGFGIRHGQAWQNNPFYAASLVSKDAYPQLIADSDDFNFQVKNLSVTGWTSAYLKTALENNNRYCNAVAKADIITLNIGGNDLLDFLKTVEPGTTETQLAANLGAVASAYATNLSSIFTTIKTLSPDATIVYYSMYNPLHEGNDLYLKFSHQYKFINEQIFGLNQYIIYGIGSKFTQTCYVDLHPVFESTANKAELFVDLVHPNIKGQQLIYEATATALDLPQ